MAGCSDYRKVWRLVVKWAASRGTCLADSMAANVAAKMAGTLAASTAD